MLFLHSAKHDSKVTQTRTQIGCLNCDSDCDWNCIETTRHRVTTLRCNSDSGLPTFHNSQFTEPNWQYWCNYNTRVVIFSPYFPLNMSEGLSVLKRCSMYSPNKVLCYYATIIRNGSHCVASEDMDASSNERCCTLIMTTLISTITAQ